MENKTKNMVTVVLVLMCLIGVVVVWKLFSAQIGMAVAGVLSMLGFGGKGAVRKVKKRAKLKAKQVPDTDPDAITADINEHINKLGR